MNEQNEEKYENLSLSVEVKEEKVKTDKIQNYLFFFFFLHPTSNKLHRKKQLTYLDIFRSSHTNEWKVYNGYSPWSESDTDPPPGIYISSIKLYWQNVHLNFLCFLFIFIKS